MVICQIMPLLQDGDHGRRKQSIGARGSHAECAGPQSARQNWLGLFIARAGHYCCFGGAGGLLAGAVVAPGVAFFFFFFFFALLFGAVGSAAGA